VTENLEGPNGVIRTKGAEVVCPLDGKKGAAYVHCLQGNDHVGEVTHMLSYSRAYSICDIIDTLTDFCRTRRLDPRRTYVRICCLCVNQHRVVAHSALEKSGIWGPAVIVDFFAIFGERGKRIGRVLAMMAPWKVPVYLSRIWCIYEFFMAHTNGCKVDIVMPPEEKSSSEKDIMPQGGGIDELYEMHQNTEVHTAKASVDKDRPEILKRVESTVGYQMLNNQVNHLLCGWMQHALV
jgi:hypothetical protein